MDVPRSKEWIHHHFRPAPTMVTRVITAPSEAITRAVMASLIWFSSLASKDALGVHPVIRNQRVFNQRRTGIPLAGARVDAIR